MGLVKQCITSLYKKNIQRLTKVWIFQVRICGRAQLEGTCFIMHQCESLRSGGLLGSFQCHLLFAIFCYILLQTFLTLSLADMANRVQLPNPKEAEKYVLHMVSCQASSGRFPCRCERH